MLKPILLALALSASWALCHAADEAEDMKLLKRLGKNDETGYAIMQAAMMGGLHHNLTACGLNNADDPFFAENNPLQQQTVREMQPHAPDMDTATLNRLYRLAYTLGYEEAGQLFDKKRCHRLNAEGIAREQKRIMESLKP